MRPILWGTIWFVIGMVGWVGFSILAGLLGNGFLMFLYRAFGMVFFFSLPVAIIVEIICWIKQKRKEKKEE